MSIHRVHYEIVEGGELTLELPPTLEMSEKIEEAMIAVQEDNFGIDESMIRILFVKDTEE